MTIKKHYRLYSNTASLLPKFWPITWCTLGQLPDLLEKGWIIDDNNLFGPDGANPREAPKELLCTCR